MTQSKTITSSDERLYRAAVRLVLHERKAATYFLQMIMGVRYEKAKELLERMERSRIISKPDENGERQFFRAAPEP
jgi:S-DNA-T family DNA segregation ATPase FtsK/SpoIIIE